MTQLDRKVIMILFFGALVLFGFRYFPVSKSVLTAEVQLQGKQIRSIAISQTDRRIIRIAIPKGIARLEIKDGAVRLLEMPDRLCPRKICSHTGWIRRSGESIICVPNQLVIRLHQKQSSGTDAVTR
jgi:hypothetical protein